jgi:hypothetical protein
MPEDVSSNLLLERFFSKSAHTEDRLDTACYWLDRCASSHKVCNMSTDFERPHRLLELDSPAYGSIKLIDAHNGAGGSPPRIYATLSHCWGSDYLLCLTQKNEPELRDDISMNKLPRTFREAAIVARKLDIRHLWIDSLCIIQDSPTDWQTESSIMGAIYQGSHCNIAATDSTSSQGGLFRNQRLPALYHIEETAFTDAPNAQWHIYTT